MTRFAGLLALGAAIAAAQTPPGVLEVFRVAAEALAERDTARFFALFDSGMEDLPELRQAVAALVARDGAESTVSFLSDAGDENRREVRLNWLLRAGAGAPKRGEVRCTLERREGRWKIVALAPVDFFRMP